LLGHIITNKDPILKEDQMSSDFIKYEQNKNIYLTNGDKISINDFSLIDICEKNKEYILVTDDKKIIRSARTILDSSRVLNFQQFLDELKELNVLE